MADTDPVQNKWDVLGKRVVNTIPGYGPGVITCVEITKELETLVKITYDNGKISSRLFSLDRCLKNQTVYFEPECDAEEKRQIYTFLTEEREVRHLVHFTPDSNLRSILMHGIMPRELLSENGIHADTPDGYRLDKRLDYSSFSISFPNYQIFYSKRNTTDYSYVVLLVDPKIILALPLDKISYLPQNAASSSMRKVEEYTGLAAVQALFPERMRYGNKEYSREQFNLPPNLTTNPQAEVFIGSTVRPGFIRSIITIDSAHAAKVQKDIQMIKSYSSIVLIDDSYFTQRSDWSFWKKQPDKDGE